MVSFFALLLSLGLGMGLSCWILGTILYKSNTMGDNYGAKSDYGINVMFTARKDRLSGQEQTTFASSNSVRIDNTHRSPNGTALVRRLSAEELSYYDAPADSVPAQPAEPQVAKPVNDIEAEFRNWENEQFNNGQNNNP